MFMVPRVKHMKGQELNYGLLSLSTIIHNSLNLIRLKFNFYSVRREYFS